MAVFAKKKQTEPPKDLTIAQMQGRKPKTGHVGIEIECESSVAGLLPKGEGIIADYWNYERDGSLRGADNAEYILSKPIPFDKVDDAIDKLFAAFAAKKVKLSESVRTSMHVHLNVMPFYQNRLATLLGLWFIFEEVLSYWCGDHRVGNLFCIRAKDGESIIRQIKNWLEYKGKFQLNGDGLHYSALNMAALSKYGSIEIRTMHGPTTPAPAKQWVRICKKLYDESAKYEDPRTLIEKFSLAGPLDFFMNVFGEEAEGILKNIGDLDLRDSLFEGMRFAQEIVYARDWSDFRPTKVAIDPFGRRGKNEELPEETPVGGRTLDPEPAPPIQRGRRRTDEWLERAVRDQQAAEIRLERAVPFIRTRNPFGDL